MAKRNKISLVQLAAKLYGCAMEELLSYREYEDGSVVIIAPSGQKFTYSAESIMQFVLKKEPEVPEGPEVTKVANEHAGTTS